MEISIAHTATHQPVFSVARQTTHNRPHKPAPEAQHQKEKFNVAQILSFRNPGAYGDLSVAASSAALGASVPNVDIRDVDEETLLHLRDVLFRYEVLVLPGQVVDPAAQAAFLHRLFPASPLTRYPELHVEDNPNVQILSNIVEDGVPVGVSDAGQRWHSDGTFRTDPEPFVSLYAVEVPTKDGVPLGDTQFVSASAAYDSLSESDKEYLSTLRVRHSFASHLVKSRQLGLLKRTISDDELQQLPDVTHSLIRTHPVTGRRCIYVNESFSANVVGLEAEASDALLKRLIDHLMRPEFLYEHHWSEGDLVVWDNVGTQHRGVTNYGTIRRRMHRVTMVGSVPEGPADTHRGQSNDSSCGLPSGWTFG